MDPGPRSVEVAATPWRRAALVWMLLVLAETANGYVREVYVAPRSGALAARQLGVLIGCVLIFGIALATARWLGARTRRAQFQVGVFWVALTLGFEFAVGRAMHQSWDRLLSDYNPLRGGFLAFGMAFMFLAPWLASKLRGGTGGE